MEMILFISLLPLPYLATVRVINSNNPIHALLNLVVSLLAVAMIFFMLGAPFAGALRKSLFMQAQLWCCLCLW